MNASHKSSTAGRRVVGLALAVALVLTSLAGTTGCDQDALDSMTYPINAATQNVPSWDGWASPQYTSSLGLPESPWSYWNNFFAPGW
jgi:hypothetical protein